jgi:transcription-repair coupling factor (superfamily II helicase)
MNPTEPLLDVRLPTAARPTITLGQLHGSAMSLAMSIAIAAHDGPACVLAPSAAAADRHERELAFFAPDLIVRRFPDYETLPYEAISPPQELLSERIAILHELASGVHSTVIVNAEALLHRLPGPDFIVSRSLRLSVGDRLDRDELTSQLVDHGYLRVGRVDEPGEFAVRGELLDVFPSGTERPVRIDLFDDEVESLRLFDPETQRSEKEVEAVNVLPAREFPFDEPAIRAFRQRFRETFPIEPGRSVIYRDISDAMLPAGIEYYLPLFFDQTFSLVDYLDASTLVIGVDGADQALEAGWELVAQRFEQLGVDNERPLLQPPAAFWPPASVRERLARHRSLVLTTHAVETPSELAWNAGSSHPLGPGIAADIDRFARWLGRSANERTLLVTSSAGRREVLKELLAGRDYSPRLVGGWAEFVGGSASLAIGVGELEGGLALPARGLRIVTAEQIGMEKPRQRARRRRLKRDPEAVIRELTDLRIGAPVVHEDHGIGRYRGLVTLDVDGAPIEFLLLEYAGNDKLYVPVHNLHLVGRYTGAAPESAPLHRLGTDQWARAKRKAAQQARDVAAELLNLYAQRAARKGTNMETDRDSYERFAMEFPFEETEDQSTAIESVLADLRGEQPMDRIVCGDVGFGKTEVAVRSAFVAAEAGFQTAVLVPTTLLAQQHYRTFSDRFADWPIKIGRLSRLARAEETTRTLAAVADGTIDIVIGTHRLLQRDVEFKRLGLVVVDEEHRFGVKDKEKLKKLRADVDILTMTATPIPRTLNMTLGGLRDLSIIATPPAGRLSVRTFVGQWHDGQVREAVLREIRRGGQVYFVHNRIDKITSIADRLRTLIPEAQIEVGHGQMSETALERVMIDFYRRRFNVLVCTTIIESGIDIPTANTIIINRADTLGLAQLHQLRGRVGRSHHQAYAYLLTPPPKLLTADAQKRLEALESLDALGSGFALATHDLEIRGAGELLGEGQSGQIQAIGFTLYNELLARAVRELREGREPDLEDPFTHGPEVETGLVALIPEDYMPDVHMRLVHYKRIASAATRDQLDELQVELIDRFGLLPAATKTLFAITWLKLLATSLGVSRVQLSDSGATIEFASETRVEPTVLIDLIEKEPGKHRLDGPNRLLVSWDLDADEDRLPAIERLFSQLGANPEAAAA